MLNARRRQKRQHLHRHSQRTRYSRTAQCKPTLTRLHPTYIGWCVLRRVQPLPFTAPYPQAPSLLSQRPIHGASHSQRPIHSAVPFTAPHVGSSAASSDEDVLRRIQINCERGRVNTKPSAPINQSIKILKEPHTAREATSQHHHTGGVNPASTLCTMSAMLKPRSLTHAQLPFTAAHSFTAPSVHSQRPIHSALALSLVGFGFGVAAAVKERTCGYRRGTSELGRAQLERRAVGLCSPCLRWWGRLCRRRCAAGGCARAVLVWGGVSRG